MELTPWWRWHSTLKARADNPVTGATRYLAIDQKIKPFDNLQCRIAVQYGVSKVDWQTARGGPIGGGDIATTMLNPDVKGFTKFDLYPDNNGNGDVAKAKDALSKCGKPNGFTTHLATTNVRHFDVRAGGRGPYEQEDAFGEGGVPTGNVVSVEQEMIKLSDTQIQYQTAANIYQKAVNMFRTALGGRSG